MPLCDSAVPLSTCCRPPASSSWTALAILPYRSTHSRKHYPSWEFYFSPPPLFFFHPYPNLVQAEVIEVILPHLYAHTARGLPAFFAFQSYDGFQQFDWSNSLMTLSLPLFANAVNVLSLPVCFFFSSEDVIHRLRMRKQY